MKKLTQITAALSLILLASACGQDASSDLAAVHPQAAPAPMRETSVAAPAAPATTDTTADFAMLEAPVAERARVEMYGDVGGIDNAMVFDGESVEWAAIENQQSQELPTNATYNRSRAHQLDRMVVRNAWLDMETTEFQRVTREVDSIVLIYGGFIEHSSMQTRRRRGNDYWVANYTIRIPVTYFDMVNRDLMSLADVIDFNSSSEDVTMHFADMESRLSIRLEEERRILAMIENAEDIEDLIRLERRLGDLRIRIESYRRQMTQIDHQASFSTITLTVMEVSEEEEVIAYAETFGDRMANAFGASVDVGLWMIETIAMGFAFVAVPLSVVAVLSLPVLGGIVMIRRMRG